MPRRDDDDKTNRQIARSQQRRAGDRSAQLANALMKLSDPAVKKLELDDDLREAIDRARAVTTHIARRRAERTLAGVLRRNELGDVRQFHLAEQWRAKLIEQGMAGADSFPATIDDELPRLVDAAQRERATGRPPGAARALFRHITTLLKSAEADTGADDEADGDDPDSAS